MPSFKINVLGCGSALPTSHHLPSAQIVEVRGKLILLDCGEGVQLQLRNRHLNLMRISHIFITHAHGDHCFGLPGLLSTFSLLGRKTPLHIFAPATLQPFFDCIFRDFCYGIQYEVTFTPLDSEQRQSIFECQSFRVTSLPLRHRVPCCGYLIEEQPSLPHIIPEMIAAYDIPHWAISNIKAGADWTSADGSVIAHEQLTRPADPPCRYAYCTDTLPNPELPAWIEGVDMLYHEATYADADMSKAVLVGHSTARQAAAIARDANAGRLLIGHFSARYSDESILLREAQEIFPATDLAFEGQEVALRV
ncbi:MAG: ribonuclease Z [Bacteroidaceae bacterium]|nr:ribonuclease Z [Bacteroidaceae bacterium]